ncbi:MAG: threonine/serine dehydratase [Actinomycetales bacterium]
MTLAGLDRLVSLADIRVAAARIAGEVVRTPLLPQPWADPSRPLWLKPESLQPTGAFKLRGAVNALRALSPEARARGVVAQSSGNHAQAVAYAARRLEVRATIVMPHGAAPIKIEATRRHGADVVMVPPDRRETVPRELADEHGWAWVPPYDHPDIVAGQGTVGLEIGEDFPRDLAELACVLVPISGGGLSAGVATALAELSPSTRIVAVEPELAGDAAESLRTGTRVTWSPELTYRTVADGLRTTSVGAVPWEHVRRYVHEVVTVTEDEIRDGVRVLARSARLVAEPSGAVTVAAYLHRADALPHGGTVAIVSGGNVDPALFAELLRDLR